MSTATWLDRIDGVRARFERVRAVLFRVVVGDRVGAALFLATVCFAGLYWRLGFFINDNITLANGLVALADGHFAIEDAAFRPLASPGTHELNGKVYARNYGQIAFAVPILLALRGLGAVADLSVAIAGLWSLCLLALAVQVGHILDRARAFALGGSMLALGWFLCNVLVARPIAPEQFPILALQVGALLATALTAVFLYRLLAGMHGRRVGLAAGCLLVGATSLSFWATIPKRHVLTAALFVGAAYSLYRSRTTEPDEALVSPLVFRASAYVLVGLLTWIHAAEGFILFVALVAADVPTAPRNDRRSVGAVAAAFFLGMAPFFLTNTLIAGNPAEIPRMLPLYAEGSSPEVFGPDTSSGGGSTGSGGTPSLLPPALVALWSETTHIAGRIGGVFLGGFLSILDRPESLYRAFVRGGYISSVSRNDLDQAIYLTVLESSPVLAGAVPVAGAALLAAKAATPSSLSSLRRSVTAGLSAPRRAVDVFVLVSFALLFVIYVPRFPLFAQVTTRYLLPIFPLAVYGMARQPSLRRVLDRHGRLALWTWVAGVAVGVQLLFVVVAMGNFGRGGAFQVHALINLAAAGALATLTAAGLATDRFDRATAVAFGVAAALGTNFLLLSGLVYFQYGQYVLPAVDALADLLGSV